MSGATRRALNAKSVLGLLSLAAALALASPGVRVVRAGEPRPEAPAAASSHAPAAAGVCFADTPLASSAAIAAATERVRQQLQSQLTPGQETPIALNNRGYNYASESPAANPHRLALERLLQQ